MLKFLISIPSYDGKAPLSLAGSLLEGASMVPGRQLAITGVQGNCYVEKARDFLARQFLFDTNFSHIFWIDADMTFPGAAVARLVHAAEQGIDFVCALYRMKQDDVVYRADLVDPIVHHERLPLIKALHVPAGFMCISREVMEKAWDASEHYRGHDGREQRRIFKNAVVDGEFVGEDYGFCDLVRSLGFDIWVDPDIHIGHVGQKTFEGHFLSQGLTMEEG